jgi:alpha-acetolactate decarboxylase
VSLNRGEGAPSSDQRRLRPVAFRAEDARGFDGAGADRGLLVVARKPRLDVPALRHDVIMAAEDTVVNAVIVAPRWTRARYLMRPESFLAPMRPDQTWAPAAPAAILCVLALVPRPVAATMSQVTTFGTFRALVHEGNVSEKVRLAKILEEPHAYAVGALTSLAGEVTIVDGKLWLAYPGRPGQKGRVERSAGPNAGATLLVATHVPRWRPVTLERAVGAGDLDATVERLARRVGLTGEHPFAFLIEGDLRELQWHVVDGSKVAGASGSHEEHMKLMDRSSAKRARGTLVGFFSKRHHGVFTHAGSNTHVHVVLPELNASGHLDAVSLPKGTVIQFPDASR